MILVTIGYLSKTSYTFKYFVGDATWDDTFDFVGSNGIAEGSSANDLVKSLGLKEVSFDDLKTYTFNEESREILVLDGIDWYNDMDVVPHWYYDDDDEKYYFGIDYVPTKNFDKESPKYIAKAKSLYVGKDIEDTDTIYAIHCGGSLDADYAQSYKIFACEEDANACLALFEEGEYGPYIFLNDAYAVALDDDSFCYNFVENWTDVKKLIELSRTKKVVFKQAIYQGTDVYN